MVSPPARAPSVGLAVFRAPGCRQDAASSANSPGDAIRAASASLTSTKWNYEVGVGCRGALGSCTRAGDVNRGRQVYWCADLNAPPPPAEGSVAGC